MGCVFSRYYEWIGIGEGESACARQSIQERDEVVAYYLSIERILICILN